MKNTKLMLAFIATLLLTYLLIGLIIFLLSDLTYKESVSSTANIAIMVIIGWLPACVVVYDLDNQL